MFRRVKGLIGQYEAKSNGIEKARKISTASHRSPEESPARREELVVAGVKENEELLSKLRQAAVAVLASRKLPTGEPSSQELEMINAEVLRRGREFLQNHDSVNTRDREAYLLGTRGLSYRRGRSYLVEEG